MLGCCCSEGSDRNEQAIFPTANDLVFVESPDPHHGGAQKASSTMASSLPSSATPRTGAPSSDVAAPGAFSQAYFQDEAPIPPPAPLKEVSPAHSARSQQQQNSGVAQDPAKPSSQLSEEQKQLEKDRLQEMVKSFAKQALQGLPCTYIDDVTGMKYETHYKLCKKLQNLMVLAPASASFSEVRVPIAQVEEIFVVKDGTEPLPREVIASLDDDEKTRLLMVCFPGGRICILDTSMQARDTFLTCMRILRLYCVGGS